jgi:hypothetical protein
VQVSSLAPLLTEAGVSAEVRRRSLRTSSERVD